MRKIIHVDMDAFYAAVEQRDQPELRGKPVVVGGSPHSRAVVATASYEARAFGLRSAMACSQAYRLCPEAIFVAPRFELYKAISSQIREIFHRYTALVEPLALDEAYLDVTENYYNEPSATRLAIHIKEQIATQIGLTASAGVSFNKFLAKLASGWQKPNGLTVITPAEAPSFVQRLSIDNFYGVGKVTKKKMIALGIRTGADLLKAGPAVLRRHFGKMGEFFYHLVHCQDERPVDPDRERKSIGKEITFERDIDEISQLHGALKKLSDSLELLLKHHGKKGRTVTLKIKYHNFKTVTRSQTLGTPIDRSEQIVETVFPLLRMTEVECLPIRLIGISLSKLSPYSSFISPAGDMFYPLTHSMS